jgi:pyocin large subunit-like protein
MKKFEHIQPDFLFCELPIKDGTQNDERIWIYHRLSSSLIEFVNIDEFPDFQFKGKQDRFEYEEENWFGVFVQNNCEYTDQNENEVLKKAWKFLENYLIWEDNNIDNEFKPLN